MLIDVKQANINTVSVEVQQLIVNNKKMTLSVFRQIPDKTLIVGKLQKTRIKKLSLFSDEEIEVDAVKYNWNLRGKPWGLVNYFWGKQPTHYTHVVWQNDKVLHRSLEDSIHSQSLFGKDRDSSCWNGYLSRHPNAYIQNLARENLKRNELYEICEGYNAYVDYINKLPQLYIAV